MRGLTANIVKCKPIMDAWARGANLLGPLRAIGPLFDDMSDSKNGPVHPISGMHGFRVNNSSELCI